MSASSLSSKLAAAASVAVVATALVVPSAQAATPEVRVTNTFNPDTKMCTITATGADFWGGPVCW